MTIAWAIIASTGIVCFTAMVTTIACFGIVFGTKYAEMEYQRKKDKEAAKKQS